MVLRFALDWMLARLRYSALFVLLVVLTILIIVFSAITQAGYGYAYSSADHVLRQGLEKTGVIRSGNYTDSFLEELLARPEICTLGSTCSYTTDDLPELCELQRRQVKDDEGCLEYELIATGASNLCEIRLSSGTPPEELDFMGQKNTEYLYLGSAYDCIPVGTVYESQSTTYIVAGILDKNQRWIRDTLKNGFTSNTMDTAFDCDYRVLAVTEYLFFTSDLWICASDGYTMDQAVDQAFLLAKRHGIDLKCTTLQTYYETRLADVITLRAILSELVVIVCFSCVVMLVCIQLLQLLSLKKDFGILYAIGFSQSELWGALVVKNILTAATAFLISVPVMVYVIRWWVSTDQQHMIVTLIVRYALPIALTTILGVIFLSSLVLLVMLRKIAPVQMIGGQND